MKPRIGAHVSAAGGVYKAIENAEKIGAECIQIFGASPRMWRTKQPAATDVEKFKTLAKEKNIGPVYLHASYLVNLASANELQRQQSIGNLIDHLQIAESLDAVGLIFHLGSSGEDPDKEAALQKTVNGMKTVLENVPGKAALIMENSAGGGKKLGSDFKEIGKILKRVGTERVKVCIDTAHIYEAGGIEEYSSKKIKKLFDDFDEAVGLKHLTALHINDSKTKFDSHHDRHENIGEGYIGIEGFHNLAKEKRLWDKDWLLEVPGFDGNGPDKRNVEILKSLFK